MLRAVFRADASTHIGGGHIMRCLTLANFLADHGWTCCFAIGPQTMQTVPALAASRHEVLHLKACSTDQVKDEAAAIGTKYPVIDLLIVDHYERDSAFEMAMRPYVHKILVIDDIPKRSHACDVLLDQTLGRKAKDYDGIVPDAATLLVGTDYALLRPEFRALRPKALARRQATKGVQNILVSLGASDPHGITKMCLEAIKRADLDAEINIALGNGDPDAMGLSALSDQMSQTIRFHGFEANIADLMVSADLAIGAAGSTSWERCCLGLPTLMIVTADNQLTIAKELDEAGAAVVLPRAEDLTVDDIAARLGMINNGEALQKMSDHAADLCDGSGALRAFLAIMQSNQSGQISLQVATMADAQEHLEWQSHPNTRKYFRNSAVPTEKQHMAWMADKLAGQKCILLNIVDATENCGILRLDSLDEQDGTDKNILEISILIAPHARGGGLGGKAVKISNKVFAGDHVIAEIHRDNTASWQTFLKAGFRQISEERLERVAHIV